MQLETEQSFSAYGTVDVVLTQDFTQLLALAGEEESEQVVSEDPCGEVLFLDEIINSHCETSDEGKKVIISGKIVLPEGVMEEKDGYFRFHFLPEQWTQKLQGASVEEMGMMADDEESFQAMRQMMEMSHFTWKIIEHFPGEVIYSTYGEIDGETVVLEDLLTDIYSWEQAQSGQTVIVKGPDAAPEVPFEFPNEEITAVEFDRMAPELEMVQRMRNELKKPCVASKLAIDDGSPILEGLPSARYDKYYKKDDEEVDNLEEEEDDVVVVVPTDPLPQVLQNPPPPRVPEDPTISDVMKQLWKGIKNLFR